MIRLAAALVAMFVAVPAFAGRTFRIDLPPGSTWHLEATAVLGGKISLLGKKVTFSQIERVSARFFVDHITSEGAAEGRMRVERVQLVKESSDETTEYDSGNECRPVVPDTDWLEFEHQAKPLLGMECRATVWPSGTLRVEWPEAEPATGATEKPESTLFAPDFCALLVRLNHGVQFVDHPVEIGDKWAHGVGANDPAFDLPAKPKATWFGLRQAHSDHGVESTYASREQSEGKAVDRVTTRVRKSPPLFGIESGSKMTNEGTLLFDATSGTFQAATWDTELNGVSLPWYIPVANTMKLRVTCKITPAPFAPAALAAPLPAPSDSIFR